MFCHELENKMKSQEFFVETLKNSQLNKTRISFLNPYSYPLISRNKKSSRVLIIGLQMV